MKIYKVVIPNHVLLKTKKMGFNQIKRLENLKKKLETNPYAGKRLGQDLFEKKWGPFRILYIIIEDVTIVIIVDYIDKKGQRIAIDSILSNWKTVTEELKRRYI